MNQSLKSGQFLSLDQFMGLLQSKGLFIVNKNIVKYFLQSSKHCPELSIELFPRQ